MRTKLLPIVLLVVLWLILLSALGYVASVIATGHGAVALAPISLAVGTAGATAHVGLFCLSRFRRQNAFLQAVLVWCAAESALFLAIGVISWTADSQSITRSLASADGLSAIGVFPLALAVAMPVPLAKHAFGLQESVA